MTEPKAQTDTAEQTDKKVAKQTEQNYFLPDVSGRPVSVKASSQADAVAKAEKLVKSEGDKK